VFEMIDAIGNPGYEEFKDKIIEFARQMAQ
jgi:hypothetical protein